MFLKLLKYQQFHLNLMYLKYRLFLKLPKNLKLLKNLQNLKFH